MEKQKVVVIGGGFAGLQFINNLDADKYSVLLLDKVNYHQFQPLFYQVATSQLEPSNISFPLRYVLRNKKDVKIRLAEVLSISTENKLVHTDAGVFNYDILVISTGCKTNFFGNKNIEQHALTLKSTYEAITIQNQMLESFEMLFTAEDSVKEELLNLVIVGGGPTGVELAGAFSELKKDVLPKDYPNLDLSRFTVHLIEGSANTLNSMSATAKNASEDYLKAMGVNVILNTFVKDYDGHIATLSNGDFIKTRNLIWAAGVTGNLFEGIPVDNILRGRVKVNRMNQSLFDAAVYVVGDLAYMETPLFPSGHPQVANVAINQAKNLAKNLNKSTYKEFEYKDLGSMATVGKHKAVVDLSFVNFKGYFAWFIWMFLHLMLILSVRNKIIILINWSWNYFTKNTALRLLFTNRG